MEQKRLRERNAGLYDLMSAHSTEWLEAEARLRLRGTQTESLHQLLSAAYAFSQLATQGELPAEGQRAIAERLPDLLERALVILRNQRNEARSSPNEDLGLGALLRQLVHDVAEENGWHVDLEVEPVDPGAKAEMVSYFIVREALQSAARTPGIRRVRLALHQHGDQMMVRVVVAGDEGSTAESPLQDHPAVLLTQLLARSGGGSCIWKTVPGGLMPRSSAMQVELTLPLSAVGLQTD